MSSITLSPDASGTAQFTIAAPGTSTNRTLTLPDETGTITTAASALSAAQATDVGVGQTWQEVSGSRAVNTSYQNTTGKPIQLSITLGGTTDRFVQMSADNSTWVNVGTSGGARTIHNQIVPPNWYYRVSGAVPIDAWAELR